MGCTVLGMDWTVPFCTVFENRGHLLQDTDDSISSRLLPSLGRWAQPCGCMYRRLCLQVHCGTILDWTVGAKAGLGFVRHVWTRCQTRTLMNASVASPNGHGRAARNKNSHQLILNLLLETRPHGDSPVQFNTRNPSCNFNLSFPLSREDSQLVTNESFPSGGLQLGDSLVTGLESWSTIWITRY
jgi:hypothetical protein